MENFRIEKDVLGEVKVPADKYWMSQTQRSLENFRIGTEKMPRMIIESFMFLKKRALEPMRILKRSPINRRKRSPGYAMKYSQDSIRISFLFQYGRPVQARRPI